jgi:hypothetical protein
MAAARHPLDPTLAVDRCCLTAGETGRHPAHRRPPS